MSDQLGRTLSVDDLCEIMHDAYELEADRVGWATQESTQVPWRFLPEPNKRAMRAAVMALLEVIAPASRRSSEPDDTP